VEQQRQLRVGLIGCGSLGTRHARGVCGIENVELAAVCDAHQEAVQALSAKIGKSPPAYTDHRRMLDKETLDAVIVVTPNSNHRDITLDAAAAGAHIFCEKPMAVTLDECDDMIEAVERAGIHFMIGYMRRFQPAFMKMKEIIDSGAIGPVRLVHTLRMQGIGKGGGADGWQYSRAGYGGLYSLYSHELDQFEWLAGKIASIEAVMNYGDNPVIEIEDTIFLGMEFADGAVGSLGCTRISPTAHFTFTVAGTKGCMTTDDYSGKGTLHVAYADKRTEELPMSDVDEYKDELVYFFRCLRDGVNPEPGARVGRRVVEVGRMAYDAFKKGKRVRV
jgi:predicted dehydrogenase